MAYILNKPYDPSTFPGPTVRRPPYYELGPSVQIPNAPFYPQAGDSKWHADVSGLGELGAFWDWLIGKKAWVDPGAGFVPYQQREGGIFSWLARALQGGTTVAMVGGKRVEQGWLSKIFGSFGGGLKDFLAKLKQGGGGSGTEPGPEPGPGGGTGTGTGTNQPKTIAGLDPNILLVVGALAVGGIFLIMSRPTSSGQPQIIMPEMFRPKRTYARRRTAPKKRTTLRRRR